MTSTQTPPDSTDAAQRAKLRSPWPTLLASLLFCAGAGASVWAWLSSAQSQADVADAEFARFANLTVNSIDQRLQRQVDLLASFQALFRGGGQVSRVEFHRLFEDLRVSSRFPGVQTIAFSRQVSEGQRPALEATVRADRSLHADGYRLFEVHPRGPRSDYIVAVYVEPMHGNEAVMGYDGAAEPVRREVADRARDSGLAAATAPIKTFSGLTGLAIRAPVYRAGAATDTLAARRAAYLGQISSVVTGQALLQHALPQQASGLPYRVRISDIGYSDAPPGSQGNEGPLPSFLDPLGGPDAKRQVWGRSEQVKPQALAELGDLSAAAPERASASDYRRHTLNAAGRLWQVEFSRPPIRHTLGVSPLLVLIAGLLATLALSGFVARMTWLNRLARAQAERSSAQARANAERLETVFNSTVDGIITLDAQGYMLSVNRAAQHCFGYREAEMLGRRLNLLLPDGLPGGYGAEGLSALVKGGADPACGHNRSLPGQRADTSRLPIELGVSEMEVDGQRQFVCLVRDLSDLHAAEQRLAQSAQDLQAANALREAVFRHAAFALIVTDRNAMVRAVNPAAERLLGYSAEQMVGKMPASAIHDPIEFADLDGAVVEHLHPAPDAHDSGRSLSLERQVRYIRQDGHAVPVSLTLSALRDAQGQFDGLVGISYDVTERQRMAEHLLHMAYHDGLTGLANRVLLEDRLGQAISQASRDGQALALLFIDLDRFKPINDTYGHAVGDQVLCEVARRLLASLRTMDTVARVGGDEFVVLLTAISQASDCLLVADKLVTSISEPIAIGERWLEVGASVGVAHWPDAGVDAGAMLRSADAAMYRAKQARRQALGAMSDMVVP